MLNKIFHKMLQIAQSNPPPTANTGQWEFNFDNATALCTQMYEGQQNKLHYYAQWLKGNTGNTNNKFTCSREKVTLLTVNSGQGECNQDMLPTPCMLTYEWFNK